MKELAYYPNTDLCSIKGIDHSNLYDIAFIQGLFQNIIEQTNFVSIEARRLFSGSEYMERELNRIITEKPNLVAQIKDEELKLFAERGSIDVKLINLFPHFWFSFEQIGYLFSTYCAPLDLGAEFPWHNLDKTIDFYKVYKEIEEDVVWIEKSSGFDFSPILSTLKFDVIVKG